MLGEPRPDRFEYGVRFVCGALLGLACGVGLVINAQPASAFAEATELGMPTLVLGLLAAWLGDSFWRTVLRLFH